MIDGIAIYVLWLREMTRFVRAKSRVIVTLGMPLFFMAFLGFGFSRAQLPNLPAGVDYIQFLVPGIVGMTLLFSSTFTGISVLWDREFGFLKEIMVAPVVAADEETVRDDLADLFAKYHFRMIPVVNREDHILGVIRYKDIMRGPTARTKD